MKNSLRLIGTLLLSTVILLTSSVNGFAAAVKTSGEVTTDRTFQNRITGVLKAESVAIPRYATEAILKGNVVIDGPKLVLKVNGVDVSAVANLQKIADKTWTYSYRYQIGNQIGDVAIQLEAYTIYVNGKPAGDIHTRAALVTHTIHVPYVQAITVRDFQWGDYNRVDNTFAYSHQMVKLWDDGFEMVSPVVTGSVSGLELLAIYGSDPTFSGGVQTLLQTMTPPVVLRDFAWPEGMGAYQFVFEPSSGTYTVTFPIVKEYSNGTSETVTVTLNGLMPGASNEISWGEGAYQKTTTLLVPAAPVIITDPDPTPVRTLSSAVATFISKSTIAENSTKNNYRVLHSVTLTLSDNSVWTFDNLEATIPFNSGNQSNERMLTKGFEIEGVNYSVTYTLMIE